MQRDSIDYPYARHFVERLNALIYKGKPVHESAVYDGFNIWQMQQQHIMTDMRHFSRSKQFIRKHNPLSVKIKNLVLGCFFLFITACAIIKIFFVRNRAIVYSVDKINGITKSDARNDVLYQALAAQRKKYIEVFHSSYGRSAVKNFIVRKRVGIYLEALFFLSPVLRLLGVQLKPDQKAYDAISFDTFSEEERPYARMLLGKYLLRAEQVKVTMRFFSWIFSHHSFNLFLSIDDVRYAGEIVYGAKKHKVSTVYIQHGHFTKYHIGWLKMFPSEHRFLYPDIFFVWSSYWKHELTRLGTTVPADVMVIGGAKEIIASTSLKPEPHRGLRILIPYEIDAPKTEVKKYMVALATCPDVKLFFKIRTDIDAASQYKEYGIDETMAAPVRNAQDIINEIDVVAGTYSTFLYDMIAYAKPIAYLATSMDFGENMVINHLADRVDLNDHLCEKIHTIARLDRAIMEQRKAMLYGNSGDLKSTLIEYISSHAHA
jgi:hypothetical protein